MLTSTGYITDGTQELKRLLTVRPNATDGYVQPPAFRVFREKGKHMCIPRYFGEAFLGKQCTDKRSDAVSTDINFIGHLRKDLNQNEAFEMGVKALEETGGGVLSLPCGYGKSITSLAIATHFKLKTMIMVHKEFLASQWREVINKFCPGASVGMVQGDRLELDNDFVICMMQTMSQRDYPIGTFDSIGILIVDEAHHICARVFSQCMFKLCPKYTIGLTATPIRKDGLTNILFWFLGPIFYSVERTAENVQVKTVHFEGPFPPITTTRNGQLSMPEMITDLTNVPERNDKILKVIDECLQTNRNIIVLTDRREHCKFFLDHYGEIAGLYIGGMSREDQDESAKKSLIIATFSLAQEGLDIPKLDTAIFASPKSDIIQAAGRILRSKGRNPVIYDVVDHWSVFYPMFKKRCIQYHRMQFAIDEQCAVKKTGCLL
jgi:superfamily II DNA or RNA helicase